MEAQKYIRTTKTKTTYKLACEKQYTYYKKHSRNGTTYWRCDHPTGCGATIICKGDPEMFTRGSGWDNSGDHMSHAPDFARTARECAIGKAKELVMNHPLMPIDEIWSSSVIETHQDVQAAIPTEDLFKRIIRYSRSNNHQFKDTAELKDVILPTLCKFTLRNEKFLFYDNEKNRRMFIFTTEKNIQILKDTKSWICDGTFKARPQLYGNSGQIYTIHGIVQEERQGTVSNVSLPLVYCFLPDKKKRTYDKLFSFVKDKVKCDPAYILVDFEKAAISSISKFFPRSQISGCGFHLAKNIFKKIQKIGLQSRYKEFAVFCRMLCALAYIPLKDVSRAFKALVTNFPDELKPLVQYFKQYYIGSKNSQATFPPQIWTAFKRVKNRVPRSSNLIEGWHNRLISKLKQVRPPLWRVIYEFKREQQNTENVFQRIDAGIFPRFQRKKNRKLDKKFVTLCASYQTTRKKTSIHEILRHLRKMSNLIPHEINERRQSQSMAGQDTDSDSE